MMPLETESSMVVPRGLGWTMKDVTQRVKFHFTGGIRPGDLLHCTVVTLNNTHYLSNLPTERKANVLITKV